MQDRLQRFGNLEAYYDAFHKFGQRFFLAYVDRKNISHYRHPLPLEWRGCQFSLIELDDLKAKLILTCPPLSADGSKTYQVYCKVGWPDMPQNIDDVIAFHHLGEFVWQHDFPNVLIYDDEATWGLAVFAGDWIADQHMAATNPSFEEAQRRMTAAYSKLFELEHFLKAWIGQTLTATFGPDWWNRAQINPDIMTAVAKNQADTRGAWLDDYDTSILRFADFPALRNILFANQRHFLAVLGASNWFRACLSALEPQRNRIGHVNTLSMDDMQDFLRDANRIIEAIRPHVQLR